MIYFIAALGAFFGGLDFPATKIALTELTSLQVLAGRWGIAGILFLILAFTGKIKVDYRGKKIWPVLAVAFSQPCIYSICETYAVDLTSTMLASIMYAAIPVAVTIISVLFLHQRTNGKVLMGVAFCFVGIAACLMTNSGVSLQGNFAGSICLAVMILSGAIFALISDKAQKSFTAIEVTCCQAVLGGLWFNLLALAESRDITWYSHIWQNSGVLVSILYMGVLGTCVFYLMFHLSLEKLPVTQASVIQINVTSLTGVLFGIFLFRENFGVNTLIGLVLVLTGVIAVNYFGTSEKTVQKEI